MPSSQHGNESCLSENKIQARCCARHGLEVQSLSIGWQCGAPSESAQAPSPFIHQMPPREGCWYSTRQACGSAAFRQPDLTVGVERVCWGRAIERDLEPCLGPKWLVG